MMGIRFRRSVKLGKGLRLNLSKGGAGLSLGGRNMRMGVGPRGAYRSMSIPGTGIYAIDYMNQGKSRETNQSKTEAHQGRETPKEVLPMPEELKSFNYPVLLLIGLLLSLPFQTVVSILFLAGYLLARRQFNSTPKGQARQVFKEGKQALENGDTRKARAQLDKVQGIVDVPSLYPVLGSLNLVEGDPERASRFYAAYLERSPEDLALKHLYGVSLKQSGAYEEAVQIFQDILKQLADDHPSRVRVISELGDTYLRQGKPDLALEILKSGPVRARKLDEDRMYFKYLLGLAYKETGEDKRARTHLQRVYAEDHNYRNVAALMRELDSS